jgi:hypothetical protein
MSDQEIWFERWLWSYMPIHWKGWAVVFCMVLSGLAFIGACKAAASLLGHPNLGDLGGLIVSIMIFGLDPFLRRHSKKFI